MPSQLASSEITLPDAQRQATIGVALEASEVDFLKLGFGIIDLDEAGKILWQSGPIIENQVEAIQIGTSFFEHITEDSHQRLFIALAATETSKISLELRNKSGRQRIIAGLARKPNLPGSTSRTRLLLKDETPTSRLHAEYLNAEDLFQFGLFNLDVMTGDVFCSRGLSGLVHSERSRQYIHVSQVLRFIDPRDRSRVLRQCHVAICKGIEVTFQCRIIREDGQRRMLKNCARPEIDENGRTVALVGHSRDVTELNIIESELKRIDHQHRMLMDNSNDLICQLDPKGTFLFLSAAAEQLTGYKPVELIGVPIGDIAHPEDAHIFLDMVKDFQSNPKAKIEQYRLRHKDGHFVWVESTICPMFDKNGGKLLGLIGVCRDISERKRAEEALVAAQQRAEIANRAKTKFLANMSHELRTPLNAIIGFSEILTREMFGPLGTERYNEYSALILESGRHLLDLINDLLDTAKIEAGRYEISREIIDLDEMSQAALRLLKQQAENKRIILAPARIETTHALVADLRAVKQIIINLLSNAIKFTPPSGSVELSIIETGPCISIVVTDTGIGIPASEIGRLARPFEQVHTDLHVTQEGTGLGLALVNSLAQLHGGDIEIQSTEGDGTCVVVRLPHSLPEGGGQSFSDI